MNKVNEMPPMLTMQDVADRYGVPVKTLYEWRSKGLLPVTKISGGRYLFTPNQARSLGDALARGRDAVLSGFAVQ